LEADVPDVGALAGDAEFPSDLGLGAALGASGLKGGALFGRVGAAGGRHRRTLNTNSPGPSTQPTKLK